MNMMQGVRKPEIDFEDSTKKIPWGHKYFIFMVPHKSSLRSLRQYQRTKITIIFISSGKNVFYDVTSVFKCI